jgi:hypothetical protein
VGCSPQASSRPGGAGRAAISVAQCCSSDGVPDALRATPHPSPSRAPPSPAGREGRGLVCNGGFQHPHNDEGCVRHPRVVAREQAPPPEGRSASGTSLSAPPTGPSPQPSPHLRERENVAIPSHLRDVAPSSAKSRVVPLTLQARCHNVALQGRSCRRQRVALRSSCRFEPGFEPTAGADELDPH